MSAILLDSVHLSCQNMSEATQLLTAVEQGEPQAAEKLLDLVYDELRHLASAKMAQQAPGQTLQPTALVHEAWLRLVGARNPTFRNSTHFFAAAAEAMRHILIDRARRKQAERHGGHFERVEFEEFEIAAPSPDDELLAVHEVLDVFSVQYPVQAELVKLRYFVGMTNEEASQILGISLSTLNSYWNFSRAWLFKEIRGK